MCWFIGTISRVLQGPRFKALWNAEIRFSEQESVGKCTRFAHARSQSSVKFWKIAENLKSMHPRCSGKTDLHLELCDVSLFPSPFSKKMLLNAMQMHQICVREISEFRKILKNRWKSEVNGSVVQWKNGSTPRIRWCRWPNRPRSLRKLRWISEPFSEPFLREIYFMLIMIFLTSRERKWSRSESRYHAVKADTSPEEIVRPDLRRSRRLLNQNRSNLRLECFWSPDGPSLEKFHWNVMKKHQVML